MKKLVSISSLIAASLLSSHVAAETPNWNYVEASYADLSLDDLDVDTDGFALNGSFEFAENFFLAAGVSDMSKTDDGLRFEYETMSIGLGFNQEIATGTDFYGIVSIEHAEAKLSYGYMSDGDDDNGMGLRLGVRSMVASNVELDASAGIVKIGDESYKLYRLGGQYFFTDNFSAGASFESGEDYDTWMLTGRYSF
ncbi:porin family protein [Aestuariibacter sp. AA17]|uniref:Porin family protein n=1 Tax=Fluctibacter corallii TaxID=2984329 RepID=A0ABT3A4U9_9ALTE|nr:porin family protein [Aestuariibacter sp. AA17]MCV2883633.1 porin family protein [Aestuariibacter sp. AA17]